MSVVQFPTRKLTPADKAGFRQWAAEAWDVAAFCGCSGDDGEPFFTADAGEPHETDYIAITREHPDDDAEYHVVKQREGWVVVECRDWTEIDRFRTLRAALESICPTLPGRAAG